jgi:hypothetical protein
MIFFEISFESGGYLLFLRSKSLNQKEIWQMKIYFDSHLFTQNIPLDGHNVTLKECDMSLRHIKLVSCTPLQLYNFKAPLKVLNFML